MGELDRDGGGGGIVALKDGLLHWWELDATSWLDSHGSWHLTNRTAVSINSTGAPDGGPAAVFNGSHYLDRTDVAWDGSGAARSAQIWGKRSAFSSFANYLINHRDVDIAKIVLQLDFRTPTTFSRAFFSDGVSFANPSSSATLTDTWYHIVATTSGANRHRIWINGELSGEVTTELSGTVPSGDLPFAIGTAASLKTNATIRHIGLACLAAIWEREVSESEVVQLYNSGAGLRYAALDMVSGSGTKIARLRRAHAGIRGMRA